MSRRVGIFGTAGMAVEAADIALALGLEPILIAKDERAQSECDYDLPLMLETGLAAESALPCVVAIGDPTIRHCVVKRHSDSVTFTNLIHPSASFGHGQREAVDRSIGVIVCAGVRMTSRISVGDHTIFNLNCTVSHDSQIGDFSVLSPQACILGNVVIEDRSWVGANATINQGTPGHPRRIGADAVIGSGAVVISDCVPGGVYAGVPARVLK